MSLRSSELNNIDKEDNKKRDAKLTSLFDLYKVYNLGYSYLLIMKRLVMIPFSV